jgi:UDP-glucuronate decarboxylase
MSVTNLPVAAQKTVLVAGGAGFIGSHLCETLLEAGHRVLCVDNLQTGSEDNLRPLERDSRFRFIEQDICTPLHPKLKVDQIYNLACAASPPAYQADPIHTMMTSVVGTKNLLDHAAAFGASFVQASTSEVYGDPEQHPQREAYLGNVNCTGPRACYDEGKRAAEALCFDFSRLGRADIRVARIFNTYGPRMQPDDGRIVSNFLIQALSGDPITVYGSGEQTRSFCYVSDLVRGLVRLMNVENAPATPVNLGNPEEYKVNEFAQLIAELVGSKPRIVHEPLPQDDPQRRRPDISLAKTVLGWAPEVPLSEGLPPTAEWFAQCLDAKAPRLMQKEARTQATG